MLEAELARGIGNVGGTVEIEQAPIAEHTTGRGMGCVACQRREGRRNVAGDSQDAVVERQRGAISPTAFQSISTQRQLDTIRAFMARLPDLLDA